MAGSGLPSDRSSPCAALPCGLLACLDKLLHASHFAGCKPDFDAARVEGRFREDVFHHTARTLPGTLVMLLGNVYFQPRPDVFAVLTSHVLASLAFSRL